MSLPVHLVPSLDGVVAGSVVEVTGDEAHHAVAVRRLREGEQVVLTDGAGRSATGEVASTGKRVFTVTVSSVSVAPRPSPTFTVVQALPKGERGELAVEVLTEVGVDTIVPWAASRSVAVWRGERAAKSHARWAATAREAAKQARRAWHPMVTPLATTREVCELAGRADLTVVLHEEATTPLASLNLPDAGEVVVVVGPEGGIAPDELAAFTEAGAQPVRLGAEVLRTSTAGVAAVSAMMARTPRWGSVTPRR
ncbi:16S rRNA (uracil(1498)-N(3))-methyltransferase [Nocardioides gansuensis]|uniref:Ribosomal RNA small subunit methyltransferase E n=1 Tax=Nocardioides gansuensis TaxID=2138300 RepID=A0A2T8FCL5_9ACTN|nr:16S rRNA (uracil(1498)-N(3))-methyltransferase [Nocardioides gansuensis]PVG83445.1 16S rRNA (uracil(1498)-N(3))-methyltransferase [Nocardioides gansuensis]